MKTVKELLNDFSIDWDYLEQIAETFESVNKKITKKQNNDNSEESEDDND